MSLGYRSPLQLNDIAALMPQRIRTENAYVTLQASWKQSLSSYLALSREEQERRRRWLLLKTIGTAYGWMGWAPIVLFAGVLTHLPSQAQAHPPPLSYGILLAFLMFLTSLASSVAGALSMQLNADRGMEIRSGLIGIIYRKAMNLSPESRRTQTTGSISNHMSVDAEKWTGALNTLPQWISVPLEIIVALWMLYNQLGWCALVGLFTVVGLIPIQNKVSDIFSEIKDTKLTTMDSRIRLVTELFSSIRTIKLHAWESAFKERIARYRTLEMGVLRRFGKVYAAMTFIFSSTMFMSLLSFSIYAAVGGPGATPGKITPQVIFVSLALFGLLSKPISWMDHLLSDTTSILVSTDRIQHFLLSEELENNSCNNQSSSQHQIPGRDEPHLAAISVSNGVFSWSEPTQAPIVPTLRDINFALEVGSLTAVVGRVGQGKSSLISALIGDMYQDQGTCVHMNGSVAYVSQEAWVMNSSIQDNILFGQPLNQARYDRVLSACSLLQDLEVFPAGDQTEVGERGISLSGGQKQRLSLARAAYQDADIYLLDDALSAVDAHVDHHLWNTLLGPNGLLRDKTRLIVTHGLHHLSDMDQIIIMNNGTISDMNGFNELLASRGGFYQLYTEFSSKSKKQTQSNSARKDESQLEQDISDADGNGVTSINTSGDVNTTTITATGQDKAAEPNTADEKMVEGGVGWDMFMVYAKAASYHNIFMVIFLYILVEVAQVSTSYWLRFWPDSVDQGKYTVVYFLIGYGAFTMAYVLFNMALFYVANIHAAIRAAQHLHDRLLNNLLRQPMSFFDITPIGRIINRFSTDVDAVDESIIWNFIDVVYCLVAIGGTLIVISISTPQFLVVMPPLTLAYLYIQQYYISSSQALKRFMSISKSPLYQHFSESLAGVSTIRAMGATARFIQMNEQRADISAETALAFGISGRWLKIRLEVLGALIVFTVAFLAVLARSQLGASVAGLSLTYAMSVTLDISYLVRAWSEMSNQLISVERIEEYAELREEAPEETDFDRNLPQNWPSKGHIVFSHYSAKYREHLSLVLKDISLEVQPGEKIGIVGRTGAGKSSLTLALFRMIEAAGSYWARATRNNAGGTILIDGVDIARLGLKTLRKRLSIIPQNPTLFAGTIRQNLDPFDELEDIELWTALERAHLKDYISSLTGGLSFEVASNGENFSVGQRSLICLARALLCKSKVLVMDEATAMVDVETDALIQKTVRKEFKDRTVLTIAHRIKTIMDSDRVLVLDRGYVKEFDAPEVLLARKDGFFYSLVVQAGAHS
ncbi:P-loop containing nucleoside triphosphate hydrolase protein [Lobosporangium transversale]|uniref:p-loop containing nucleoside triphosphate hydrolase protein n=1 Tax=Lobosporangium transversale TaxID=64571 RepID=A0A1Y2G7G6_9FUNG|nr:P-loop containing nucleoside triphosphate hydrolase protein [Lobosporangium transversale]ORZ00019.1 P-loop containing nucleoside triphosphate hydrolase protein [Lobosporangium transversale]|eukprot:XP_021876060.1 P-loop containing nucleoside triphosphate hydrolase protein [Lobosporangium transversale]